MGFAAPVALAAMALAAYLSRVVPVAHPKLVAAAVVCLVSLVHGFGLKAGARFQVAFTVAKVLLIAVFSACGILMADPQSAPADALGRRPGRPVERALRRIPGLRVVRLFGLERSRVRRARCATRRDPPKALW